MGGISLFFIALGLSMDAFAVCLSNGMCYCSYGNREAFSASLAFGIFQAGMPLIGYFAGQSFSDAIRAFDHWIALILLGFIGGKMLLDGIRELRNPEECITKSEYTFRILLLQAIGTSIDAFAMGMGFAVMGVNIFVAAAFIGCTTFICSLAGCGLGRKFGMLLGARAQAVGGIILLIIGLRIFMEHVFG
ncbi:MAG: manganese efflux pump [Oscillospiraceae bacterium]|nr:manganese efflux pump [Oscillospiraceae bacterium]MCI9363133.1 manganese efflux pump [Oscillospiraceae bacterium]RKJ58705.1 manganese efflux pump [bacterium 1XD42-8]RKJ67569.1 manganese efflux pump [bacterium 1XD42-1]